MTAKKKQPAASKKKKKKLNLDKDTTRKLSDKELGGVAGGAVTLQTATATRTATATS